MADTTHSPSSPVDRADPEVLQRVRKRHGSDLWLMGTGLAALLIAFAMLAILITSIVYSGYTAFTQSMVTLEVSVSEDQVNRDNLRRGDYDDIVEAPLLSHFPGIESEADRDAVTEILSRGAQLQLRDRVISNPDLIGRTFPITVPLSDPYDQLNKGRVKLDTPESRRRVDDQEVAWFQTLEEKGLISRPLNWELITNADSRFPELAGLQGALWGSFYALLVCFLISFPVGIAAAVYLEAFAPRNRFTDIIEVNINNLAAVPSVVFGLLALAVFLGWFGLPRSAPLVGGMTLSLMTLPTIIIATRAAVKAVPPSIREAALGLGASKHEVVLSHVLPLAMPGILTGTIIGLAQALGETAPLLLTFLILMNALAIFLRKKLERRW